MKCTRCGSDSTQSRGRRRGGNRYVCGNCGKWFTVSIDQLISNPPYKATIEQKPNGEMVSDKLIEIMDIDLKNETKVLLAHGFDPELWTVVSYRHNYWHGPIKAGRQMLYQSRVTVRPKAPDDLSLDDIDNFFSKLEPVNIKFKAPDYVPSDYVLEIALADLHIDRMTHKPNDVEYNFEITIADLIQRIEARKLKLDKIYLVPLGDTFDYDTAKFTTSGGTQQLSAGAGVYKSFDTAVELFVSGISALAHIAPVELISIPGNHDRTYSYMLAKTLEAYFLDHPGVTVDTRHDYRKYRKIGVNLVGWCHGEMNKKYIHTWLQNEARELWGETKNAEVHAGHIHIQVATEKDGVIVRYLPTTTEHSLWENEMGFIPNKRSTASFLWDKNTGLREMWFSDM